MILLFLYILLSSFLWPTLAILSLFFPKGRERFCKGVISYFNLLVRIRSISQNRDVLWLHAASGGEYEQLKPLLPHVRGDEFAILQSFFSPTIYRKEHASSLHDISFYHPLDSFIVALFTFAFIKPKIYIVNRHDVWPAHLLAAKMFKIETVLINGNVHESSKRFSCPFISFNKRVYSLFNRVFTGSNRLKSLFISLGVDPNSVVVLGDTRLEQVKLRAMNNPYNHFDEPLPKDKTLVLGSVIKSDYPVILDGINSYIKLNGSLDWNIIFVPHEVGKDDIRETIRDLESYGFSWKLYTSTKNCLDVDILIVDTVGILAELYGYASSAYVGAGFGAGVHSVAEPAVYGIPVAYGPNISLLDEAITLADLGVGTIVRSADDFTAFLTCLDDLESTVKDVSENFFNDVSNISESVALKLHIK